MILKQPCFMSAEVAQFDAFRKEGVSSSFLGLKQELKSSPKSKVILSHFCFKMYRN